MLSLMFLELTLRKIVSDIPHGAGPVPTYTRMAPFIGSTWTGSRRGSGGSSSGSGQRNVQ